MVDFVVLAVVTGGALSWFASTHPDGLEWSIEKVTGKGELPDRSMGLSPVLKTIQEKTAFLPDYNFKPAGNEAKKEEADPAWPGIEAGTSIAGVIGAAIVLDDPAYRLGIRSFRKDTYGFKVAGSSSCHAAYGSSSFSTRRLPFLEGILARLVQEHDL